MLQILGLSPEAEAVYRALLSSGDAQINGLVDQLGMPEEQILQALEQLSALALLHSSEQHPSSLHAVSPAIGMEVLLARQQAELAKRKKRIEESREVAARVIAEYAPNGIAETGSRALVGLAEIRHRLKVLTRGVHSEIMALAPDGAQTEYNMAASRPLDRELLGRGVRMRSVFLDSVRGHPASVAHVEWLTSLGGEVRTVVTLPTRMIIIDRTTAIMPANAHATAEGAVELTGHGSLTALIALFEMIWDGARIWGEPPSLDGNGLTGREVAMLKLLAGGLTDDAVAKRLGISPRTERRIASNLMRRLGARSRFEAGVMAIRNGWLPFRD